MQQLSALINEIFYQWIILMIQKKKIVFAVVDKQVIKIEKNIEYFEIKNPLKAIGASF